MARIPILKKDGSVTAYFWSDRLDGDQPLKTVYRTTPDGRIQRSKSVRYNVKRQKLQRI